MSVDMFGFSSRKTADPVAAPPQIRNTIDPVLEERVAVLEQLLRRATTPVSSAEVEWGGVVGEIENQSDLMEVLEGIKDGLTAVSSFDFGTFSHPNEFTLDLGTF